MNVRENLKKLGQYILDLVFPISCQVCGKEGLYLCPDCKMKLPKLSQQQCLVCQKPAPFGKTHPNCVTRNSVDGALSALSHKDLNVQNIIRIFKYDFVSSLSKPLSDLIIETIKTQGLENYYQDFIIVPVPLHAWRLNWRGFNQAALLGQSLAESLNISMDENLIERRKNTKPQVRLSALERNTNIENAFKVIGNVANKKILLVDDLVTSGSTANELAKLLKSAKAAEVWITTAAHG